MSWVESAKEKSARYHGRALPEAELISKAADVKLYMQLESTASTPEPVPLRQRAEHNFSGLPAARLKAELVCFLPFFVSCALGEPAPLVAHRGGSQSLGLSAGRDRSFFLSPLRSRPHFSRTLYTTHRDRKVRKVVREAWAKTGQVAAGVALDGVFGAVAVAAPGGAAVSIVDVAYLKRHLELGVSEAAGPLNREKFGELFAG
jgi:hypothetical protein